MRLYERAVLRRGLYAFAYDGRALTFRVHDRDDIAALDSLLAMERHLLGRMISSVRPGDVLFDVGANIGALSVLIADSTRSLGVSVHAFEPNPATAGRARENAVLNQCKNIVVHTVALGRRNGDACLYTVDGDSGRDSIVAGREGSAAHVGIRVERGDDIARCLPVAPSIVKIDVEGAEMDVLLGMERLFGEKTVRDLFVEVHPARLKVAGHDEAGLVDWLECRRYRRIWQEPRGEQTHQHFQRARG